MLIDQAAAPVSVGSDLVISVGQEPVTRLSTDAAFRLAETLIRTATRRMVEEEAGLADCASGCLLA